MANPLSCVAPALRILERHVNLLRATGAAVQELQHPDQEEIDDSMLSGEELGIVAESPVPSAIYHPTPPLSRREKHIFRYFVDGSIRMYYLGTAIEGRRSFPVELAQIGAAVIKRADDGRLKVHARKHKILLLVVVGGDGLSDSVTKQLERTSSSDGFFEFTPVRSDKDSNLLGADAKDPRNRTGGKARFEMHKLEVDLIHDIGKNLRQDEWIILDGGLKIGSFPEGVNIIGVAKSFSKTPRFSISKGRRSSARNDIDITSLLANLPYAHRTSVFRMEGSRIGFWYVRLRPADKEKQLDYHLMGVVKVEAFLNDEQSVPADLADLLSRALVAERNVTPYGRDRRWHCHLYPIYIAEQVIKNGFFSQEVLMGALRQLGL